MATYHIHFIFVEQIIWCYKFVYMHIVKVGWCEGCFCDFAMWRAEDDHDVGLSLGRGSQTQNSTNDPKYGPRASGTLSKNIKEPRS